jgi:aldehyde dehydrogenase (NAD+)
VPAKGCYFAPTLVTGVDTASEIVQDEVFGPVLTVQTFRTPNEAVDLANHTRYGLAACVWSESISLALEVAPRLKAGVVWVNSANQFDAACGFGGYRESGFGREGGREGLLEYLQRVPTAVPASKAPSKKAAALRQAVVDSDDTAIDRTPKLYIGGKQVRPDGGYSRQVWAGTKGNERLLGVVPEGNRKDIRNAVEAARAAAGWERNSAHGRAQVLYYLAENLSAQRARFVELLATTATPAAAAAEFQSAVEGLFTAAAWADKFDGAVHQPPVRGVTLALHEAMGVVGFIAPDTQPLLGLLQLAAPALAMGNRVVAVPSSAQPLVAAELYALLDTSDLPGGTLNLVTGAHDDLADTLAAHADVDAFWWPAASPAQAARVQALSASNLKRTWVGQAADQQTVLEQAVQVKNVWVPYGV